MKRLISIIIAGCLVFLAFSSLMVSKKNDIKVASTGTGTVATPRIPPPGTVVAPPPSAGSDIAGPEVGSTPVPVPPGERESIDKKLEELAKFADVPPPPVAEPQPQLDLQAETEAKSGPRRYSQEEGWQLSTQAANDLSALNELLN